jgi:hypothetical protein
VNNLAINGCSDLLTSVITMQVSLSLEMTVVNMLMGTLMDCGVVCFLDRFGRRRSIGGELFDTDRTTKVQRNL